MQTEGRGHTVSGGKAPISDEMTTGLMDGA